ncbi:hypothetical protein EMPS_04859 [Entomortierella parvispora]|uniref:Uncharacterized protein n=1 Tax=Entomortierella parvispora TaxID=205924 RepID=A0A9P3H965_9FUNG|nr:hypothetical protein EMPS_04859 [Entomortierella parvispora]
MTCDQTPPHSGQNAIVRRNPHALIFRHPQETLEDREVNTQLEIEEATRQNTHSRSVRGPHAVISLLTSISTAFDSADSSSLDNTAMAASVPPENSGRIAFLRRTSFWDLLGALTPQRSNSHMTISDKSSDDRGISMDCGDEPQIQTVDECCTCAFANLGVDSASLETEYDPNVVGMAPHDRFGAFSPDGHDLGPHHQVLSTPGAWPASPTVMMATSFFSPLIQGSPDLDPPQEVVETAPVNGLRGPQGLVPCSCDCQETGEDLSQGWMHLTLN